MTNYDSIPEDLKERNQWVCWREEKRDGDLTKVPVNPHTGSLAKSNDSDSWGTFDEAREYHKTGDSTGLGFMFNDSGTIAGVDLDKCRDPDTGEPEEWAKDIVQKLDSYTEISPSGTGYHILVHGFIPDGGNRKDGVEMYDSVRFFTMTGDHVDGTPETVKQRAAELQEVHAEFISEEKQEVANGGTKAIGSAPANDVELTDSELLEKARNAENGDKFSRLFDHGDTSGYPSHSEADLALAGMLAFWSGGVRQRIDQLFRKSNLYREKWEREDYRNRTIDKALDGRSEFYNPQKKTDSRQSDTGDGFEKDLKLSKGGIRTIFHLDDDQKIGELPDRKKASGVWALIRKTDDYHVRVRRENGSLWAFDGGVWKPEGERALRHAARKALGGVNYGQNVLSELKAQAKSDPKAEVTADTFGLNPGEIAVEDGLLNLKDAAEDKGQDAIQDLQPRDYALAQLNVEYDPEASYEKWERYVEEWAEDGKANALQEYVGYCLHVGELNIHRALLLVGSGANGKGTFLRVVRKLLGRDNTTSIELQTLANEKDALADFYGSIANIDDDLSARKLGKGLGMFKKLTGGDRVRARRLYEEGFEFDPTGKHLYAANEVPDVNVPDDDEAFWRRWLLVEFPNHYPVGERDENLDDKLTGDEKLSGVLNWAIEGWNRLMNQGYFTNEERYAHGKRERWQAWGDSIEKFISECVERDPDAENLSTSNVHRVYTEWCRETDERPGSQQKLTTELKNQDLDYAKRVRPGGTGTPTRGFKSLGFTEEAPELDDTPERGSGQQMFNT